MRMAGCARGPVRAMKHGRLHRCSYAHMLNHFSSVNMTKLDVLTGFDTLKIG